MARKYTIHELSELGIADPGRMLNIVEQRSRRMVQSSHPSRKTAGRSGMATVAKGKEKLRERS